MPTIGAIAGKPSARIKTPKGYPRAPKGAHGRAAVKAVGQTKTTGHFAELARTKGKGAAIAAYQNKLRKAKRQKG